MSKVFTKTPPLDNEKTGPQTQDKIAQRDYRTGENVWVLDKGKYLTQKQIDEIRKHPTVALVRQLVVAPCLAAHWSIEEKEGIAPEGAKQFIEDSILPLRHNLLSTSLYGCIDHGWLSYEKVFSLNKDSQLVFSKLKPMTQDDTWILIEPNGAYYGILQICDNNNTNPANDYEVVLKKDKTLLVNFEVEGTNWYGRSVLEITKCPYDEYCNVQKATNRYDLKVAGTHWVVHYPPGTSDWNNTETSNDIVAQKILETLESSGSIAVPRTIEGFLDDMNEKSPNAWTIELLSDMSQTTSNFLLRLKYIDTLLVRTFGIPERAVLEGEHGTKAEAGTHTDAAVINMDMRHRMLVNAYNQELVNKLLAFNYGEEYINSVYIVPAPILNSTIKILTDVYQKILDDPQGLLEEMDYIDKESIKSELGIPFFNNEKSERHTHEYGFNR